MVIKILKNIKRIKINFKILETFLHMFQIDHSEVVHKKIHGWLYLMLRAMIYLFFGIINLPQYYWGLFTGKAENSWQNAKLLADIINN